MRMIEQGGGAPSIMGPGGAPPQMRANFRGTTWQGPPRPTIHQFQEQSPGPGNAAIYAPSGSEDTTNIILGQ